MDVRSAAIVPAQPLDRAMWHVRCSSRHEEQAPMTLFNHVLVATDFGECSERALDLAIQMADAHGAELTIFHAWDDLEATAKDQLTAALETARRVVPRAAALLRRGVGARDILAAREEIGADLIVIGTHGRTGLAHVVLGSVAEEVVRASPAPVLTVHATFPMPRLTHPDATAGPGSPPMF
jgi:nucleotide-binding universal stress UspA family protein